MAHPSANDLYEVASDLGELDATTTAPDFTPRPLFRTDGSVSTGSKANDGRPFRIIRRLTEEEADPSEVSRLVELFHIEFTDAQGGVFVAWTDEIAPDGYFDND